MVLLQPLIAWASKQLGDLLFGGSLSATEDGSLWGPVSVAGCSRLRFLPRLYKPLSKQFRQRFFFFSQTHPTLREFNEPDRLLRFMENV